MTRRLRSVLCAALAAAPGLSASADQPPTTRSARSNEQAVVDALRANPLLLPYSIRVTTGMSGEIVLAGKVGTKAVHDMAIRTVIDMGLVPHDDLVIDTGEAQRVAMEQTYAPGPGTVAPIGPAPYFVYPEPLFGRLDDPFWGMEPPILSIPPAFARRGDVPIAAATRPSSAPDEQVRRASAPVKGQIQLSVDEFGQVSLSGLAATEEDKRLIEAEARRAPGVTRVTSNIQVASRMTPPPPPQPYDGRPVEIEPATPTPPPAGVAPPAPAAPAVPASRARSGGLAGRVEEALSRRPQLKGLDVDVEANGDVATISGKVPSIYEAMLAYRATEQTPGVRDVVDRLEFPLPDENHPNVLKTKARPDDLEPYLLHHLRRQAGGSAHIDKVLVQGDEIQVRGTLPTGDDPARIDALLRSIPLLRDFRIGSTFTPE